MAGLMQAKPAEWPVDAGWDRGTPRRRAMRTQSMGSGQPATYGSAVGVCVQWGQAAYADLAVAAVKT